MKVAFRTDASIQIGTGHVMRCLTLARALRDTGHECHFIMRDLPGHLKDRVVQQGFGCRLLPAPTEGVPSGPPDHAAWAGVDWVQDAAETRKVLQAKPADWLVVDHYAFDARWQRAARPEGTKLMVIDDLADRAHDGDVLLDQNLGRHARDYDGYVPEGRTRLIGPTFALLRPEFAGLRAASLLERKGRGLKKLMISMGGVDAEDATSAILTALPGVALPKDVQITVVMGSRAPALEHVRSVAQTLPFATQVVVDVDDMGARMAGVDLAIGAGGATTWERCCLGLPSIVIPIAENQTEASHALVQAGAALCAPHPTAADFTPALLAVIDRAAHQLENLAENSAMICDGDGVPRVLNAFSAQDVSFRDAVLSDARRVWDWRAASDLDRFAVAAQEADYTSHMAWFRSALSDPRRVFRILRRGALPCGYVRLDLDQDGNGRVSLCLAPDLRGQGFAATLLAEADRLGRALSLRALHAEIHADNAASVASFHRAGFWRESSGRGLQRYQKSLCEGS